MNPFLCFAHEERKKAKDGHLLPEWGKIPPFAVFIKHSEKRKKMLPDWRLAHKGLEPSGKEWIRQTRPTMWQQPTK